LIALHVTAFVNRHEKQQQHTCRPTRLLLHDGLRCLQQQLLRDSVSTRDRSLRDAHDDVAVITHTRGGGPFLLRVLTRVKKENLVACGRKQVGRKNNQDSVYIYAGERARTGTDRHICSHVKFCPFLQHRLGLNDTQRDDETPAHRRNLIFFFFGPLGSENNEALRKVGLFVRSGSPFLGTAAGGWLRCVGLPPVGASRHDAAGGCCSDAVGGLAA
jgi:hypothetical protein